jgi:hypothetical protein
MPIKHADFLELKHWNTPTIFNGWEQNTKRDVAKDGFNLEDTRDFMPQMGLMPGRVCHIFQKLSYGDKKKGRSDN